MKSVVPRRKSLSRMGDAASGCAASPSHTLPPSTPLLCGGLVLRPSAPLLCGGLVLRWLYCKISLAVLLVVRATLPPPRGRAAPTTGQHERAGGGAAIAAYVILRPGLGASCSSTGEQRDAAPRDALCCRRALTFVTASKLVQGYGIL